MTRTVIFGLDGATYTVLDDLVRRGVMPFLGRFRAEGARGILESVTPPLTPPAWTTLVTGRSPGHHGVTGFFQYSSATSDSLEIASARNVHAETIWSLVNRYGLRAGCLNFVMHAPPPRFDGYLIPGWTPWRWVARFSRPKGVVERLAEEIDGFDVKQLAMDFEIERKAVAGARLDDYEGWIRLHIERDRQWFAVLRRQLERDPVELVGIVFDGVDKLQHLLWPYLDPALGSGDTAGWRRTRELCWEYFRQIDGFLEETVRLAGPEANVLVVSDHGFTGSDEIFYVNTWLEREGYLVWKSDAEYVGDSHELEPDFYHLAAFDMTKTHAFGLTASSNGIHIAVRGGRFDSGIAPEEYEAFRQELTEALLKRCRHPETGRPLVDRVWRREEVFAGPHMGLAPDLTLTLADHSFFSVRRGTGLVSKRPEATGTHHPDGVFLARGPAIRRGADVGRLRLLDIAPVVYRSLGLRPEAQFEGCIPAGILEEANILAAAAPAATMRPAVPDPMEDVPELSDDEEIFERLKALGYIE